MKTCNLVNEEKAAIPDYKVGIRRYLDCLTDPQTGVLSSVSQIERVGYKTTLSKNHFGDHELTDEVIEGMRAWLPLLPCIIPAICRPSELCARRCPMQSS